MAATGTSNLSNVLISAMLAERIRSQINRRCVLLNLLPYERCGDPLSWTVKFRGRTAATGVSQTAASPAASQDIREKATLNVGEYADTASVTGRAQSAAALALNPLGVSGGNDLMMDEIMDAAGNIAESIANDVYAGDGTTANPIVGLATAVDGTGTYATLAQGTYSEWASTESTGALADVSFDVMRTFLTAIETASGERPDLGVSTPTVVDKLKSLYSPYDQYVTKISVGGREITLQSGARAINVEGLWVVSDPRCTSNTLYALNTGHVSIRSMPHADFAIPGLSAETVAAEYARLTGDAMTAAEAAALMNRALNGGIVPYVKRLGATGNQESVEVFCYPQLQVKGRKFHGKYTFT